MGTYRLLSHYASLKFGAVTETLKQKEFYRLINKELLDLCGSLPESMQSSAVNFLMDYARIMPGEPFDFFTSYYPPAWTLIYHIYNLKNPDCRNTGESLHTAVRGQALAMFLHSFDDHLNDGEIQASHLTLLLRSSAWERFTGYIEFFKYKMPPTNGMAEHLINDYYSGMMAGIEVRDLKQYCDLFRKQMATWLIMPLSMAMLSGSNNSIIELIQNAYESFGIAWRLLDDANDLEDDLMACRHTAVYYSLPRRYMECWDIKNIKKRFGEITRILIEGAILDKLVKKIHYELKNAEECAKIAGLKELATEFSELCSPI